jgi:hypothetical protein
MIGFIAFDFVLRVIFGCAMCVTFVIKILCVNFADRASNFTRFGIPGDMVPDLELVRHKASSKSILDN